MKKNNCLSYNQSLEKIENAWKDLDEDDWVILKGKDFNIESLEVVKGNSKKILAELNNRGILVKWITEILRDTIQFEWEFKIEDNYKAHIEIEIYKNKVEFFYTKWDDLVRENKTKYEEIKAKEMQEFMVYKKCEWNREEITDGYVKMVCDWVEEKMKVFKD